MRFVVLVIGATATGALSVAGVRTMVAPAALTFRSAPAPSSDQASVRPDDFNPIAATYDYVVRQITARRGVDVVELPPEPDVVTIGTPGPVRYFDSRPFQRSWGGDVHGHVHHYIPPARDFVHHAVPPAHPFVHHDTPAAHPVAHHSAGGRGGGGSHGGGHGRR
jgi:hypothetical protein